MKKPILVTGSHRSGSTWIGKMISKAPGVGYIHEPFNISITRYNGPFTYWFEYLSKHTSPEHQAKSKNFINSFLGFPNAKALARVWRIRNFYEVYFYLRDVCNLPRRLGQRTVIKDPIALMSAEWLYENYHCDVLITIRHPAAFIASIKVKGWDFEFENFLNQPNLINDYLSDYKEEIARFTKESPDIVDQGILLWNCIYHVVHQYELKYKDEWIFVRHEDISRDPVESFRTIFKKLNLNFNEKAEKAVIESTTASKSENHKRDAAKNINTWKSRLTDEEVQRIKEQTKPVWSKYYSDADWD